MYCQTCAAEIQTGLNYCNRCGTAVNAALTVKTETPVALLDLKSPVRTLGATITLTTLLGLTILFVALDGLSQRPLPPELLGILTVAGLLLILIIDIQLLRILSRLVHLPVAAPSLQTQSRQSEAKALPQQQQPTAQTYMPASTDPLPMPSVTEHTTRTFHSIYREPRGES